MDPLSSIRSSLSVVIEDPQVALLLLLLLVLVSSICCYGLKCAYQARSPIHVLSIGSVQSSAPLCLQLSIEKLLLTFEVDTGAGVTVIDFASFQRHFPQVKLEKSHVVLTALSGSVTNKGQANVNVMYNSNSHKLPLIAVEHNTGSFNPLLGRDWLDILSPQWRKLISTPNISNLKPFKAPTIEMLKKLFPRPFDQSADTCIEGFEAKLVLKENAQPIFAKAYPIPYGLREPVEEVLGKMVADGKAVQIRISEWASPGLAVPKKDGKIRYVADFKRTLNPQLRVDYYPLPTPDQVFSSLANGRFYTSLDLTDAYTQLRLHPDSQELCVLNTHKGLYRLTRLIYGVSSAAAIFQSTMDLILKDLEDVICYLDNILVKGVDLPDCVAKTQIVLARLDKHNVRLRLDKCLFFVEELEFLGFNISALGRSPSESIFKDIQAAQRPKDIKELRSFLGLINFYNEYLPNFSTVAKPLRNLTCDNTPYIWSEECEQSFNQCKILLRSNELLVHFDPNLPLLVSTDASPVGVGAVLAHVITVNGKPQEKPIMFASASLTPTQQNYAQVDREAFAVIFAVTKFYKFLWGRDFVIATDNTAIQRILNPEKGLPVRTSHRLQHWSTILQGFRYKIIHKKSHLMTVPDALSRLPSPQTLYYVSPLIKSPITVDRIAEATLSDIVLKKVIDFVYFGWPKRNPIPNDLEFSKYFNVRHSLSLSQKCLMMSIRVVIPAGLRGECLVLMHMGHPGIVRTKMLCRSILWWPTLSADIETICTNCEECAKVNPRPKDKNVNVSWAPAKYPFERVHIDFYCYRQTNFFIFCDAFSKWIHIQPMASTIAANVNSVLFSIFAFWGCLPTMLVSDNGPPFQSSEFVNFLTRFNIVLEHSPIYHPQSNAQAERGVGIAKAALEKLFGETQKSTIVAPNNLLDRVNTFLFTYHNTPSTVTGKSPNELLLSFKPRTLLSQCNPKLSSSLGAPLTSNLFREGDIVNVVFNKMPPVQGTVIRKTGTVTYLVSIGGLAKPVHVNQMTLKI